MGDITSRSTSGHLAAALNPSLCSQIAVLHLCTSRRRLYRFFRNAISNRIRALGTGRAQRPPYTGRVLGIQLRHSSFERCVAGSAKGGAKKVCTGSLDHESRGNEGHTFSADQLRAQLFFDPPATLLPGVRGRPPALRPFVVCWQRALRAVNSLHCL